MRIVTGSRAPARLLVGCAERTRWPGRISRSSCGLVRARVELTVRAARGETASLGRVDEIGRAAGNGRQPAFADPVAFELRERAKECFGVRVLGVLEELEDGGLLDDLAGVHDGNVVGGLGDDAHVVRDDDHRHLVFLAQALEQVEDLGLDRHVERGRRLVGDQQLRVAGERDGDHHALAHAAGELVRIVVEASCSVRNTDLLEELDRALARGVLLHVEVAPQRLRDLRSDLERRVQRRHRVLEDHRHLAAAHVLELAVAELRQVAPVEHDRAVDDLRRRLGDEAHDRESRDRLAAAGLADDAERPPLLHVEGDAVDRLDDPLTREEVGLEVVDLEQGQGA